jgi:predicted nucleic acid-binding protein
VSLVLDASVALGWIFQRTSKRERDLADRVLAALAERENPLVPWIWHLEVINALLVAERRGVISQDRGSRFLQRLRELPIRTEAVPPVALDPHLHGLARSAALSSYDACYLDLALRSGSRLATFDRDLAAAAAGEGVELFG